MVRRNNRCFLELPVGEATKHMFCFGSSETFEDTEAIFYCVNMEERQNHIKMYTF